MILFWRYRVNKKLFCADGSAPKVPVSSSPYCWLQYRIWILYSVNLFIFFIFVSFEIFFDNDDEMNNRKLGKLSLCFCYIWERKLIFIGSFTEEHYYSFPCSTHAASAVKHHQFNDSEKRQDQRMLVDNGILMTIQRHNREMTLISVRSDEMSLYLVNEWIKWRVFVWFTPIEFDAYVRCGVDTSSTIICLIMVEVLFETFCKHLEFR